MKYTMYEDKDYILIQRPDGTILFTLQPDDRNHALIILGALNTEAMKVAAAMRPVKPMNVALGEALEAA